MGSGLFVWLRPFRMSDLFGAMLGAGQRKHVRLAPALRPALDPEIHPLLGQHLEYLLLAPMLLCLESSW